MRCVDLRQGDVYTPPFEHGTPTSSSSTVVPALDDPARRPRGGCPLSPGGRLLIVDFAALARVHACEHAHRRLGFRTDTVSGWLAHAGLEVGATRTIDPRRRKKPVSASPCLWQVKRRVADDLTASRPQ